MSQFKFLLQTARRARTFYPFAAPRQRRAMAARYARSIAILGDKWILANKVERRH